MIISRENSNSQLNTLFCNNALKSALSYLTGFESKLKKAEDIGFKKGKEYLIKFQTALQKKRHKAGKCAIAGCTRKLSTRSKWYCTKHIEMVRIAKLKRDHKKK